jgi:drug/metabolite transporter (DMT)-like permease
VLIHVFYNLLLMRSYKYGAFGQVYPLARGTSPLVVTVLAAVFAAERPSLPQVFGVLVVSCGLAVLVLAGRRSGARGSGVPAPVPAPVPPPVPAPVPPPAPAPPVPVPAPAPDPDPDPAPASVPAPVPGDRAGPSRAALIAAGATGLTIAAYTTVDGLGVRLSGSSVGYIGWLMLLESLCVPAWALVRRRDVVGGASRRVVVSGVLAGALAVLAYGLVLWAQTRGALAPIAALRETSVIFGAVIGTVVFREPFGRWRIAATVLVVIGVLLLNVA